MNRFLLLVILPGFLFAIQYRKTTIDELIRTSTLIVEGEIESQTSYWSDGKIFTDYTFRISENYKGKTAKLITFQMPGGRVADKELVINGLPAIKSGERALLFLVQKNNSYRLHSMAMGYFKEEHNNTAEKNIVYYNTNISNTLLITKSSNTNHPDKPTLTKNELLEKIKQLKK